MSKIWKLVVICGVIAIILVAFVIIRGRTPDVYTSDEYGFSINYNDKFYINEDNKFVIQLRNYENSIEISASATKKAKTELDGTAIMDNYIATLGVYYSGYEIDELGREQIIVDDNPANRVNVRLKKGDTVLRIDTILISLQDREVVFYISGTPSDIKTESLLIENIIKSIKIL